MAAQTLKIALAGNPNVGKSTLFNALTGSRQHVGNWPGKTVEKKEGPLRLEGQDVIVVDLPGTYSLTAYSIEEIISRDFIIHERPGAVIAVVDAANLERNLYLVTQLLELETPVILALNMTDIARKRGMAVDSGKLSRALNGAPVIETVGSSGIGVDALKAAIRAMAQAAGRQTVRIPYAEPVEDEIARLEARLGEFPALLSRFPVRWLAVKLLESDENIVEQLAAYPGLISDGQAGARAVENSAGEDAETLITDGRYQFIGDLVSGALTRPRDPVETASDQLDRVLTHRLYGVPIFLLLMWLVFQMTANVSAPFVDWIDGIIAGPVTHWMVGLLGAVGLGGTWVESLVVDGIVAGVGGVLVFIPVLLSLYLAIGILEDSGYMARAAFVMDRVMRAIGLHGKSFLPMMIGFGCTVPAVYATRTLENDGDRKLTGFLVTFMSCGARLPVYVVIGTAFFGAHSGHLIFAMYLLGIAVALLTGWTLKKTVYRNKPPQPFVMELPPYRPPRLRTIWHQVADKTGSFVRKAGTVILLTSILIWTLLALPAKGSGTFNQVAPGDSIFGTVSRAAAPIFAPAGFGNWQASGSLITGLVAKEVVIGTMSQIYVGEESAAAVEAVPPLAEDLAFIGRSFGEAAALTLQEIVNIIPRTLNVIPVFHMPEADFFGTGEHAEDTSVLESSLTEVFTPLAAVAFTVFVLLYTPCMTTITALRHEFGLRYTLYQIAYTFTVAWIAAVIVYQGGRLIGLGG